MKTKTIPRTALLLLAMALPLFAAARTLHIDSRKGNDSASGLSASNAWKTLARANAFEFEAGDSLRLRRGSRFNGALKLRLGGTQARPIVIGAYGEGPLPVIDAKGYFAGIQLNDSHHVVVQNIEIAADGGKTVDGSKTHLRYGLLARGAISHITVENLAIHHIFPEIGRRHEGRNPTSYLGTAISIEGEKDTPCTDFLIRNCNIWQTGFKAINLKRIQRVEVSGNRMGQIGGPAIQPGNVDDLVVRENRVDGSGSDADPRMHARGSGIWPWTFMHARGKGDSCGIHIDFNCRDIVVQYNLSIDNEGGFVEILGNNHNCAYRYNISINDGARIKGENGAQQEGKILWTSGYTGKNNKKQGPCNSYIYNNTIFAGANARACFSISPTTDGLLVANNIFHILGHAENVLDDQDARNGEAVAAIPRALMQNNLYAKPGSLPGNLPLCDQNPIFGDPLFRNPGGAAPEDYVPRNRALVEDKGIEIHPLEGDPIGLRQGLKADCDFFGNPIVGKPDLGAIETSRKPSQGNPP
jgi:hypothetical protein